MARIQTNVSALNAQRNLALTSRNLAKSIAKLSSGFRINRAADDAAGLAIANKLRADGRSMRQASRNAAQANSILQISDGAVSTISTILDRMKELATQAATDNVSNSQRITLNAEFVQLRTEIGRIVDTTKYQGQLLINGDFGALVDTVNSTLGATEDVVVASITISGTAADTYTLDVATDNKLSVTNSAGSLTQVVTVAAGVQTVNLSLFGISFTTESDFDSLANGSFNGGSATVIVTAGSDAKFLVSSSGEYSGSDTISISNVNLKTDSANLDLDSSNLLNGLTNPQNALTKLDSAIVKVATAIGTIGAGQSRIEFATANVNSMIENIAAAESIIRDADLAFEMIEFTKNQILQQAGTAMLAQANAAPQGVLSLLAG